ncbi:putative cytochrome P450 [Aspergillus arachidicola]|uniref:Putative cytochrome P450 n=1 Tax=Aspergillus arachidicola TaxID=656916 RepID=A0A2G7FJQ1_9EURO|nr:putative cytochrome P450 [Aspergillus arachidicola]
MSQPLERTLDHFTGLLEYKLTYPFAAPPWVYSLGAILIQQLATRWYRYYKSWVHVPVVGGHGIIGSWIAAFRWTARARSLVDEGYQKHGDFAFQVSTPTRWEVFICNDEMVREYRNFTNERFSANALFEAKYTVPGAAEAVHKVPVPTLAKALTWQRTRAATKTDPYFEEFAKELQHAFDAETKFENEDWNDLCCFATGTRIVAHLTAKSLVGYPLSRDTELIDLFAEYGNAVPTSGFFIAMFSEILKPFAAKCCSAPKISARLDRIVMDELRKREANPRSEPQDITDWITFWSRTYPGTYSDGDIARSVVSAVFGAIHTTTQVLVHCLMDLAMRPEYVQPLREEVETILNRDNHQWTKEGLESMEKLDSFVKECQRFNPLDAGSLARRATRDFTFSNGLRIPEGTFVFTPNAPVLFDEKHYPDAQQFDGYRFYRLGRVTGRPLEYKFIAANPKYLQFGDGRHICPGRFMAADEIRLLLAHILVNYDIRPKDDGERPPNWTFKKILFPDMKGMVQLKRRSINTSQLN